MLSLKELQNVNKPRTYGEAYIIQLVENSQLACENCQLLQKLGTSGESIDLKKSINKVIEILKKIITWCKAQLVKIKDNITKARKRWKMKIEELKKVSKASDEWYRKDKSREWEEAKMTKKNMAETMATNYTVSHKELYKKTYGVIKWSYVDEALDSIEKDAIPAFEKAVESLRNGNLKGYKSGDKFKLFKATLKNNKFIQPFFVFETRVKHGEPISDEDIQALEDRLDRMESYAQKIYSIMNEIDELIKNGVTENLNQSDTFIVQGISQFCADITRNLQVFGYLGDRKFTDIKLGRTY